ncbi:hypothetical protein R5W24_005122 [Gemmata sp. JC717]|uniref:hypothetical protein n=1 Tax=Gemmata algarum TaxID=2975278 RepID=UPI0021BB7F7B|nr:hypothetical protein [Gemmata algarum]MDY3555975.1 hypothetical protein [Gemmata algarum]
MPPPLGDPEAYRLLYASLGAEACDIDQSEQCGEIAVPPGLTDAEVYRLLPTAPDFEYGGYLMPTRIRYMPCGAETAELFGSHACSFHTHPTDHPYADVPSAPDVYQFLKWPHRRTITVGGTLIWVWDKDQATIATVRRLADWESEHLVATMTEMVNRHGADAVLEYQLAALESLGLVWPDRIEDWATGWRDLLEEQLGFRVTVLNRVGG